MSEENSTALDLSSLDLSIVCTDLGPEDLSKRHHQPAKGFWKWAFADGEMALVPRKLVKDVHIEKPISADYGVFSDKIFDLHQLELESAAEPGTLERPNEVDDQVAECTPQFILRNIPKIEHYYDLDRPLSFNLDDMPRVEAEDLLSEVRDARIGDIEFIDVESVHFVDDFRAFLEEIFILCPWEQITKGEPEEDNPWHINNSTSKLAKDLLTRKNKLFIFTEKGMTQIGMKAFQPRKEKEDTSGEGPCPFTQTFGPG